MLKLDRLAPCYRLEDGAGFRLRDWDPGDTCGLSNGDAAQATWRRALNGSPRCRRSSTLRTTGLCC